VFDSVSHEEGRAAYPAPADTIATHPFTFSVKKKYKSVANLYKFEQKVLSL
jgi:hypothetical protein